MTDVMSPLPRATIGETTFFVDAERPVALVRRADRPELFLTWPELDIGIFSPNVWVHRAPDALWVVYQGDDDVRDDRYPEMVAPDHGVAVRIDVDGSVGVVRFEPMTVVGATRDGLWTSSSPYEKIDHGYRGGELPADWAAPTTLHIHFPGRPTRTLDVDRYVNVVREEACELVLFVNPSPPISHPDYSGFTYEYRCTELVLGAVEQWPEQVKFRDYIAQGWGKPVAQERLDLGFDPFGPSQDPARIDLVAVAGTRWTPVSLTDAQIIQAVKAVTDQFMDAADTYWSPVDGSTRPRAHGVHDTVVDVIGAWPDTVVQVTCRHPYFPTGGIRRSLRIFDDAGRIKFDRYASIHFMEDLDTHALPDLREAKEGILNA
ncbi:hypothetical protein ACX80E_13480 [Arthrobacter sp. TMN-49]